MSVIDGVGDVRAIAAGEGKFPWRAVYRSSEPETVVESASSGDAIAWFPVPLDAIVTHPSGRIWFGQQSSELHGESTYDLYDLPLYFFKLGGG